MFLTEGQYGCRLQVHVLHLLILLKGVLQPQSQIRDISKALWRHQSTLKNDLMYPFTSWLSLQPTTYFFSSATDHRQSLCQNIIVWCLLSSEIPRLYWRFLFCSKKPQYKDIWFAVPNIRLCTDIHVPTLSYTDDEHIGITCEQDQSGADFVLHELRIE